MYTNQLEPEQSLFADDIIQLAGNEEFHYSYIDGQGASTADVEIAPTCAHNER